MIFQVSGGFVGFPGLLLLRRQHLGETLLQVLAGIFPGYLNNAVKGVAKYWRQPLSIVFSRTYLLVPHSMADTKTVFVGAG
jgi:hypothetical protein